MPKLSFVLIVLVVSLAASGCKAKSLSFGPDVIPPRPAGATYPNWEHYCRIVGTGVDVEQTIEQLLEEAGARGWELVSGALGDNGVMFCFKRPIAPPAGTAAPGAAIDRRPAGERGHVTKTH